MIPLLIIYNITNNMPTDRCYFRKETYFIVVKLEKLVSMFYHETS